MTRGKYNKNRKRKQVNSEKWTRKNPGGTSKKGTSIKRTSIKIPETALIYEFLYGDNNNIKMPAWQQLDMILEQAKNNRINEAIRLYDVFVKSISFYYPGTEKALNRLRPLILSQIIQGKKLDELYYQELKEL